MGHEASYRKSRYKINPELFVSASSILLSAVAVVAEMQLRHLQERNRARLCSCLFLFSNSPKERIQRTHKNFSTSLRKRTGALPITHESACVKHRNASRTRQLFIGDRKFNASGNLLANCAPDIREHEGTSLASTITS